MVIFLFSFIFQFKLFFANYRAQPVSARRMCGLSELCGGKADQPFSGRHFFAHRKGLFAKK